MCIPTFWKNKKVDVCILYDQVLKKCTFIKKKHPSLVFVYVFEDFDGIDRDYYIEQILINKLLNCKLKFGPRLSLVLPSWTSFEN